MSNVCTYENKQLKHLIMAEEKWFCGRDVAKILGYEYTSKALKDNIVSDDKTTYKSLLQKINGKCLNQNDLKTIYINRRGLISLLTRSKMPNKSDFIQWCKSEFDISYDIITTLYKEQETIGQIINTFSHLNYQTQYCVASYRLDLYFIDNKIAIECDEFDHKDRDQDYETNREEFITETLGCTFIRFNPDAADFDIFKVLNRIMIALYYQ